MLACHSSSYAVFDCRSLSSDLSCWGSNQGLRACLLHWLLWPYKLCVCACVSFAISLKCCFRLLHSTECCSLGHAVPCMQQQLGCWLGCECLFCNCVACHAAMLTVTWPLRCVAVELDAFYAQTEILLRPRQGRWQPGHQGTSMSSTLCKPWHLRQAHMYSV